VAVLTVKGVDESLVAIPPGYPCRTRCGNRLSLLSALGHITATTEGEADLTWTTESASRSGGRQHDGHRERPAGEDEALLDHHIEEMLGTFGDAVHIRESGDEAENERLE
jgi:hypothetical protein